MTKLNWEFVNHGGPYNAGRQRAEYRGLVIWAEQDSSPSNPFEDWDTEPPTAVYSDRSFTDYSDGDALDPFEGLKDRWFSRNWRALCQILGIDPEEHDKEARDFRRSFAQQNNLAAIRRGLFEDVLGDMKPDRSGYGASDYLEALEALWRLRGVEARRWSSHGYSQGDWAEGISVPTSRWVELTGAPADSHARQMKAAGELWGAWAWGDVYGYIVTAPADDPEEEGETLESCWGYYGADHAESGLEEAAIWAADYVVEQAAKRKAAKLKELIRNRVPLEARPALLAEAGAFQHA